MKETSDHGPTTGSDELFGGGEFADASAWQLITSYGVTAKLQSVGEETRRALSLDFNFNGKSGFIILRRAVKLTLPANYALTFGVAGQCPRNTLEVKWIDPSGENVWWVSRPNFRFCKQSVRLKNKARHFTYAWGPSKEKLTDVAFIELVVTASSGGKGTVTYDNMQFQALPDAVEYPLPAKILENWAVKDDGSPKEVVVDLGADREFGGLVIDWADGKMARKFQVEMRADGSDRWQPLAAAAMNGDLHTFVYAPECEARYIKVVMNASLKRKGYGIKSITLKPLAFSASKSAFLAELAKTCPRGWFPHHMHGEMSYWNVTGVFGDTKKALINEEGMVEVEKLGFSLEPFIMSGGKDGKLTTWADATHEQGLANGNLPLPYVVRRADGLALTIRPFAYGIAGRSVLYVEYLLKNESKTRKRGRLAIAVRPFQVNPPWQFLNSPGGFSPIKSIKWQADRMIVNGQKQVRVIEGADGIKAGVTNLYRGTIPQWMSRGKMPTRKRVNDALGFASGAFSKGFDLAADKEMKLVVAVPMHDSKVGHEVPRLAWDLALAFWRGKMSRVNVKLPGPAQDLADTLKAQLGYILVNRNGVAIQPGTRCYDRSWARDGALTSAALLQFGYTEEARQFIEWFGSYQFDNGKIPCVVDHRGADPTPEHDSHGEYIFMVAEYYRYTKNLKWLEAQFPRVLKAVEYIEHLLAQNTRQEPHLKGILPPSISHEGYSDKPAYSNWDNFLCLKGLEDAVFLSEELHTASLLETARKGKMNLQNVTARLTVRRDSFRQALIDSLKASMTHHGIDFIPGSADRGDFDATSTTIAIDPCLQLPALRDELAKTFDKWWTFFLMRRGNQLQWADYTPYELRQVGAFIRLGQRARAHEALDWFFAHRRPLGWRHFAEVVHNDPLTPRFVGDMPHGWVGSDCVRSLRSLLWYEREDGVMVVGAGIKSEWMFSPDELSFDLPTPRGTISFQGQRSGYRYKIRLSGTCSAPIVLQLPYYAKSVSVDGRPGSLEMRLEKLPAEIVVDLD